MGLGGISRERFKPGSPNFTPLSRKIGTTNLMVIIYRRSKTAQNAASDRFGSNFSGAAFCLAQPFGELLFYRTRLSVGVLSREQIFASGGRGSISTRLLFNFPRFLGRRCYGIGSLFRPPSVAFFVLAKRCKSL